MTNTDDKVRGCLLGGWRIVGVVARAIGRRFAITVVTLRWFIVAGWVALAIMLPSWVPPHQAAPDFGDLVQEDSPVIVAQKRVLQQFDVPVLSGTTVVLHQPGGLSVLSRADAILQALATTQEAQSKPAPRPPDEIIAAIPLPTRRDDTVVTYLFTSDKTPPRTTFNMAHEYARHFHNVPGQQTYVTGFVPAQVAQSNYLLAYLPVFEALSVLLIVVIVAFAFRSVLAPVAVLAVAAVGYVTYQSVLSLAAGLLRFDIPSQLEPVLVALLLGVVTDYCVLFFDAFRDKLDEGMYQPKAAVESVREEAGVVGVAGLTVAAGTISLLVAPFAIFRGLGPALALTVLVGVAVCLTLAPAIMAILGWRLFTVLPLRRSRRAPQPEAAAQQTRLARRVEALTHKGWALLASLIVIGALAVASVPLLAARLDLSFTSSLPASDSVAQGADILKQAGVHGISAPTEVLVERRDITADRAKLATLQQLIEDEPGVADVLGPADSPLRDARGLVLARSGDAARFLVVLDSDPLAAVAIGHARALQDRLPTLVQQAGLGQSYVVATGQSLIAAEVADRTQASLRLTLVAAIVLELLILMAYLRSLVAPLVVLASGALSVTASLGLTTLLFQHVLGAEGLTFYAPFSAAVLLIALGCDYTVFSVGTIWLEARRRPLVEAIRVAVPRAAEAITIAGIILAATFALVAVIPLSTFRQIAFCVAIGLLIDTFVIRPVLTPALLTLLGRAATWPGRGPDRDA